MNEATRIASVIGQLKAVTAHFTLIAVVDCELRVHFIRIKTSIRLCGCVTNVSDCTAKLAVLAGNGVMYEPTLSRWINDVDNLAIETLHEKYLRHNVIHTVCWVPKTIIASNEKCDFWLILENKWIVEYAPFPDSEIETRVAFAWFVDGWNNVANRIASRCVACFSCSRLFHNGHSLFNAQCNAATPATK